MNRLHRWWLLHKMPKSEVFVLGDYRLRISRRSHRTVGVELWVPLGNGVWGYMVAKP